MAVSENMKKVHEDAAILMKKCAGEYDGSSEYQLLIRVIGEQTIQDENGVLISKNRNNKTMDFSILQNPADPDAIYRNKAGKQHRGYAANITEDVGEEAGIIFDYYYQVNTHSDSQFLKDSIEVFGEQKKPLTLVTDSAYGEKENIALAKEKNIDFVTTNFQRRKPEDVFVDFEFSPDGKKVLRYVG